MNRLAELNAELRRSVASGCYPQIGRLLGDYQEEFERLARGGSASPGEAAQAAAGGLASLAWAGRALRAARAHDAAALARLRAARPYRDPTRRRGPAVAVEG